MSSDRPTATTNRRRVPARALVVPAAAVLAVVQIVGTPRPPAQAGRFTVVEASIADLRRALEARRVTSRQIVTDYLARIGLYEDKLHAVITVNPRALDEADSRDRERAAGRVRGPLHGIPIALKDNIQTTDMPTTGGALAFENLIPPYEATLTGNLREAGAIIVAKTSMTELANWVAGPPTPMPGNYNAISGFGMNPYDPRKDPRAATFDGRPALTPAGSSSGIGTAANLWAANVGTETSGSILSPSNQLMLAAVKPTVGRISRYGVIPLSADQDTPGPMAKTVEDVAILLGALEGPAPDSHDSATTKCAAPPGRDYTRFLNRDGLRGARIGVPRAYFYDPVAPALSTEKVAYVDAAQKKVADEALAVLKAQGAVLIDPADIPSVVEKDPAQSLLEWSPCTAIVSHADGQDRDCSIVMKYGMKRDFNRWLASLGEAAPVKSLTELRRWNLGHQRLGAIRFGQSLLEVSDQVDVTADRVRYEADRRKDLLLTAQHGIDEVMAAFRLDALVFPGASSAMVASRPGYPTVIVPFGMIPNAPTPPFPPGFDAKPQPFGIGFTGRACSELRLLEIAYTFEQATRRRIPPPGTP